MESKIVSKKVLDALARNHRCGQRSWKRLTSCTRRHGVEWCKEMRRLSHLLAMQTKALGARIGASMPEMMNIGPDDYDFTFLKWLEEDPLMNQAAPSLPLEHARSLRRPYRDLHHMRYVLKDMRWGEIRDLSDHSAPSPLPPRFLGFPDPRGSTQCPCCLQDRSSGIDGVA